MNKPLAFHEWKDQIIKKDSKEHGVALFFRPRHWYYAHYGYYINKFRESAVLTSHTNTI